ncbi:MAG: hypothetical protein O2962_08670, partial [Cyanobacteria bacterium]|nr:hypothetical protein [Cyanobacteriota bacterium]
APSITGNGQLVIGNLIFGTAIDGTGTTKSSGNIGIGDSSPEAKLKVNGDLMVSETFVYDAVYSVTSATTLAVDWNNGNKQTVTLAHTVTDVNFTDPIGPGNFSLKIVQDGTGSRLINSAAWSGESTYWPSGTAPTLSTAANAIDVITCFFDGTNYFCQMGSDFQNI